MNKKSEGNPEVIIIGAGFSGLTLAYFLLKHNIRSTIYEKSDRTGGLIGTLPTGNPNLGFYETAANGMLQSPLALQLFTELKVPLASPVPTAQRRFIWRKSLRRWPLGLGETVTLIKKTLFKFIFNKNALRPRPLTRLEDWGKEHLPSAAQHFLLETALQGIYGAHTRDLSAQLVLGGLFDSTRKRYRGLIAPQGGMQQLIDALTQYLLDRGVQVHLNSPINSFALNSLTKKPPSAPLESTPSHASSSPLPFAICLKPPEAGQILEHLCPSTTELLKKIKMHNKTTCTIFYKEFPKNKKQWGFGCLLPPSANPQWPLGILMNSFIFSGRDSCYSENWIFSDAAESRFRNSSEPEIFQFLQECRHGIFGETLPISEIGVKHWTPALPCYDLTLEEVLQDLNPPPGIYLHGNYLGQIGLTAILERSQNLALKIQQTHFQ